MSTYRVHGIPPALASEVRASLRSPQYGHPAHTEKAAGYGPCRQCLRTFEVGVDERILFTYQPFADPTALPAPGPVFIHREPCDAYDDDAFPRMLRALPLAVEAYGEGGLLLTQHRVAGGAPEQVLEQVFADRRVRYAHVRNAEAGCFIARVDRTA